MDVLEASRITPDMVAEHGLSPEEYDRILNALGVRLPLGGVGQHASGGAEASGEGRARGGEVRLRHGASVLGEQGAGRQEKNKGRR